MNQGLQALLVFTAVLSLAGLDGGRAIAATEETTTWSITPVAEVGSAETRVSFRYALDPGDVVEDEVRVSNYSDRPLNLALGASDGVLADDGAFDVLPTGIAPTDGGSWIDIQDAIDVPAESAVIVPFTVRVPDDAAPGDHPAGVVAAISQSRESVTGPSVGLDARVGVRVHLRVAGDVAAGVSVDKLSAAYLPSWNPFAPGRLAVEFRLENTGNVRVGADSTIEIAGLFGLPIEQLRGDELAIREILPDSSQRVRTELDLWPIGWLGASVDVIPQIVGEDVLGTAELRSASADVFSIAPPVSQTVYTLLLASIVFLVLRWRRQRRIAFRAALERARIEGATEVLRRSDALV